ncbi:MAG: TetR/AcrR family transcriptional regulator [Bacteroidetes bacterium]|nr:TetR/AcrR family transcriptional regulator [Bacteroidota bacterium]
MPANTKHRILEASIHLFNQHGLSNVRLQQIADACGISVGNLAYHFKNKEAITSFVYETLFEDLKKILSAYLVQPNLVDFDRQLDQYYFFFNEHRFYLIDLFEIERSFPEVIVQWHEFTAKMILQIRKRVDYYVQSGILVTEPKKGVYDTLADHIWMSIAFWIPQQILRGRALDGNRFKQFVWAQFVPYFSENGWQRYLSELGPVVRTQ